MLLGDNTKMETEQKELPDLLNVLNDSRIAPFRRRCDESFNFGTTPWPLLGLAHSYWLWPDTFLWLDTLTSPPVLNGGKRFKNSLWKWPAKQGRFTQEIKVHPSCQKIYVRIRDEESFKSRLFLSKEIPVFYSSSPTSAWCHLHEGECPKSVC